MGPITSLTKVKNRSKYLDNSIQIRWSSIFPALAEPAGYSTKNSADDRSAAPMDSRLRGNDGDFAGWPGFAKCLVVSKRAVGTAEVRGPAAGIGEALFGYFDVEVYAHAGGVGAPGVAVFPFNLLRE